MNRKIFLPLLFILFYISTAQAAFFLDTSQTDFNAGTFSQTNATADGNVLLNPQDINNFFANGTFTSRIFDANENVKWKTIEWRQKGNYQRELPNNQVIEADANILGNVLLMHFNKASTKAVFDESGEANNGTLINDANIALPGLFDSNALGLDGNNDFLSIGDSTTLDLAGNLTITFWIAPSPTQKALATILNKQDDANTGYGIIMDGNANSNKYFFGWRNSDANKLHCLDKNSFSLTPNTFQHVALVKEGATTTAYVNLREKASCTAVSAAIATNNAALEIGNWTRDANRQFAGSLEEIALFNRSLSKQELLGMYSRGTLKLKLQARTCDDTVCAGETFGGTDGNVSSFFTLPNRQWDLNTFARNRFFQYRALFETSDGNIALSLSPQLLDANTNYNTFPDINVSKIDGFSDKNALPFFSHEKDGNLTIEIVVRDAENDALRIDLNLSDSNALGSGTSIFKDLALSAKNCVDADFTNNTACIVDINSLSPLLPDKNYFVLVQVTDGIDRDFDASDKNFLLDNTKPVISEDVNEGKIMESNVNVKISVTDALAGVKEVWIIRNSVAEKFDTNFSDLNAFFSIDGNHSLDINALDKAGNSKIHPRKHVIIDKSIPLFETIPTQFVDINASALKLVDLFNFAFDDGFSPRELAFSVIAQTDTSVIDCFIEFDRFVSCGNAKKLGKNTIAVRAVDSSGKQAHTSFDVLVVETIPPAIVLSISFGFEEAVTSNNEIIGLEVRVRNSSNAKKCFTLSAETGSNFIEASFASPSDCVNPGNDLNKTLTLKTINAASGSYPITVTASFDGNKSSKSFVLRVSQFSEIEIIQFNPSVCRNGLREIGVQVKNNSGKFKIVQLQASNEILLPSIQGEIKLDAFESRFVAIKLISTPNTAIGSYTITVFAKTDTELLKRDVSVQIANCPEPSKILYSLALQSTGCIEIEKEHGTRINFSISNKLGQEQQVNVSLLSELPSNTQSLIILEPNQTRDGSFDVNAGKRATAKDYNISIVVWSEKQSNEKSICIRVKKAKLSEVELSENDLAVGKGSNIVFTILVKNIGDFDSNYSVLAPSQFENIFVSISMENFLLEKNSEREVYVSVSATELSKTGFYSINSSINDGSQVFAKELRFDVKEKAVEPAKISITVFPLQVRMLQNDEKQLVIEISNTGSERIKGITLSVSALPSSILVQKAENIELLGRESKRIYLNAVTKQASPGTFSGLLELTAPNFSETKTIEFAILSPETIVVETAGKEPLTGFFALAAPTDFFGIIVMVVLILFALLVFTGLAVGTTRATREAWLRR